MPLSEEEQRKLDEIERAFHRDDPKFAAGQSFERFRRRRVVAAGAAVLIGMVLLVVGAGPDACNAGSGLIVSVTGLLSMVGGVALIIQRLRT